MVKIVILLNYFSVCLLLPSSHKSPSVRLRVGIAYTHGKYVYFVGDFAVAEYIILILKFTIYNFNLCFIDAVYA